MDTDDQFDILKKIREVDAPPFLLTRIWERIHTPDDEPVSVQWKWGFALTGLAVLVLNIAIVLKTTPGQTISQLDSLVSSLHLSSQNSLYDE